MEFYITDFHVEKTKQYKKTKKTKADIYSSKEISLFGPLQLSSVEDSREILKLQKDMWKKEKVKVILQDFAATMFSSIFCYPNNPRVFLQRNRLCILFSFQGAYFFYYHKCNHQLQHFLLLQKSLPAIIKPLNWMVRAIS